MAAESATKPAVYTGYLPPLRTPGYTPPIFGVMEWWAMTQATNRISEACQSGSTELDRILTQAGY